MDFSIEKPLPISINSPLLHNINTDDNWVSQLKIDEHRSFIIVDGASVKVLGWRGNMHHQLLLPENTHMKLVLDGGIIKTTIFKNNPMIYVFDVLLIDCKKLTMPYKDRFNFIVNNTIDRFVYPELIKTPIMEFNNIVNKKSLYADRLAAKLDISIKNVYNIIEGLVIKNNNGVLSYPKNVSKTPNQLKLKLI